MNITELDQYNLSDAVKFNQTLNPRLWDDREQMRPEVREALLRIAEDFREFLGVDDLQLKDITVSGSNAAYTYTPGSDIDLHLVVDMPEQNADVYQELFNAKKFQYNNEHDIKIGNADVELYVQPSGQPHHSQGIFSIKNNQWQSVPQRRKIAIDDQCVIHKTEDLQQRIDSAIESGSQETMQRLWDKIKNMRQTGLESAGEFGCDNLVFKMLRKSGHIEQLKQAKLSAHDQALSLDERRRKKSKVKYGWGSFGGYWYPGTAYAGQDQPAGSEGSESVKESVDTESAPRLRVSLEQIVSEFVAAIQQELGIQKLPTIKLRRDPEWTRRNGSFGRYDPDANVLFVATAGRHVLDVLRTLAHELTHRRQDELENIPDWGGETGSRFEDEANAMAGRIMRHLADRHPEYFADIELVEGASGYIPKNKKEARMPQYAMALSVDIKPGQTGTEANKLGLKTGPNGEPGLLMKSTNLLKEYQESKQPRRNNPDLNDPPGPETPPTMPAGTVRVDVSDVYDWYKLGQHVSNLKGLGKHDFGKGPPSTILSFGDEDTEHKYINDLEKTGLSTTDIDPVDPNQPKGMKRQKVDTTYNVAEGANKNLDTDYFMNEGCGIFAVAMALSEPGSQIYIISNKSGESWSKSFPYEITHVFVNVPNKGQYDVHGKRSIEAMTNDFGFSKGDYSIKGPFDPKGFFTKFMGSSDNKPLYGTVKDVKDLQKQIQNKQGVEEAFNNPYKTKSEKSEYGDVDMLAKLPDGTYLSIMFNKQQDDDGEEITQVEFYRNNSQEVTGEGDAQRIFATVLTSIQKYIKKYKPMRLSFSASKVTDPTIYYEPDQPRPNPESRAKLYDRLVQRYARAWGYRAFRADTGDLVIYELSRLKPAVVEDETLQYAAEKTPAINPYGGLKDRQYRGSISEMETDNQSSAKTGIYQSEVFGAKAYHSKCLEKGCDWESRRYDRIQQAQAAAKKHAASHIKLVTEVFNTQPSNSATWARPIGQWDDMDEFNFVASNGVAYQVDFLAPAVGPDQLDPYTFFEPEEEISDQAYDSAKFVSFEQKSDEGNTGGKQGIEGTGVAAEVFGIVTNVILQYIKKAKPSMLYFQAAEPNRQRLYARMAARLAQTIRWKVKQDGPAHFAIYNPRVIKAVPLDQGVAEQNELVESLRQEFELLEDEFIGEIKMSPANLRSEAAQTGAIAGMEFEMIVPGVKSDEPEPNIDDFDETCRSIDDAVEFFHDGDYNGRRDVERLRDAMENDYQEWLSEKIDEDWKRNGEAYLEKWVPNNVDESEWNPDGLEGEARTEALEEFISNMHADPSSSNAIDEFREENQDSYDESDWLDAEDLDQMSAIESAYEITWPHWTYNNKAAVDIDSVANDFSEAVGMAVNTSQRYHGATREAGKYVVEPDGSLRGNSKDDLGLEFVSPPMPIDQMLDQLKKVREWAGRNGCYTNKTTGLHINISVPEFSNDKLDYVKLALLLGDKYVLDQFGRSTNTYTKSALGIVQDRVRAMPKTAQALLDRMRGHMEDLATKAIHSGETDKFTSINTKEGYIEFRSPGGDWLDDNFDKVENTLLRFTVALKAAMNPEAYREEYLKKLYKLLEPTAEGQKGSDTVRYFADYVAGKIPAAALRSFVKQAQLQRKAAKGQAPAGQKYWWNVQWDANRRMEVVAANKDQARAVAAKEWGVPVEQLAIAKVTMLRPYVETETEYEIFQVAGNRVVQTFRAADNDAALAYFDRTISAGDRPYYDVRRAGSMAATQPAAQQPAGGFEFELSQTDIENRLGWPDQTGDANYEVVNRNTLQPVYLFIANTDQDAARKYSQIIDAMGMPGAAENYGYRARGSVMPPVDRQGAQSGSQRPAAGGNFTGVWLILDPDGYVIHSFAGVGNVQSDANRVAMQWLRANPGAMQDGVTVVPEMR